MKHVKMDEICKTKLWCILNANPRKVNLFISKTHFQWTFEISKWLCSIVDHYSIDQLINWSFVPLLIIFKMINLCTVYNMNICDSYVGCMNPNEKIVLNIFCIGMVFLHCEVSCVQSDGVCVWTLYYKRHTYGDAGLKWKTNITF